MVTTYVYSLRSTIIHIAHDGLNPLCGKEFVGRFHVIKGARPDGYGLCSRCSRRSRAGVATAARQRHRDSMIMALLVQGHTDTAVGRQLGWGGRTRVRYMGEAMRRAGAKTRFHWGYLVGRAEGDRK